MGGDGVYYSDISGESGWLRRSKPMSLMLPERAMP